jgi:hypothetical protein
LGEGIIPSPFFNIKSMTTIGEALGTLGDVLIATMNTLHDTLIETQKQINVCVEEVELGSGGVYNIFLVEQNSEEFNIINRAISELLPNFNEIVQILHKRQLQGLNVNKNKIGEYSKKATISREKAEEKLGRDLSHIKFINSKGIEFVKYNWLKFHEVSNVAGFGNVDLNFSNDLFEGYNTIHIDAQNLSKRGIISIEADGVSYYQELVNKYGYEAFELTLEEIGITNQKLEEKVAELTLKALWYGK